MKRKVLVILVAMLASLVSIPVGESDFRITLGIVVMAVAIQVFNFKKVIPFSVWTGLFVCLARVAYVATIGTELSPALIGSYFLEIAFYIGYGLIYHFAILHNRSKTPLPLVLSLVLCDFGGNSLEYLLRFFYMSEVWSDTSLVTLLLAAVSRSIMIILLTWLLQQFVFKIEQKQEENQSSEEGQTL